MSKHVAKLTLQLAPPLTSSGSVLLQFLVVLLPISTMLLPVMPVGSSSEIVATVLSRGGAHVSNHYVFLYLAGRKNHCH
jgi:hypothetical protein